MSERKIKPVSDNADKQRTYRMHKGKFKRAMENGLYAHGELSGQSGQAAEKRKQGT